MTTDRMRSLQMRAAEILATGEEAVEQITSVPEHPPCFETPKDFQQWLRHNVSSPTPMRPDFPAEPNYCRDCTPAYQAQMKSEGRCLFPMVRFQLIKDIDGDPEIVGYTPKRFIPQIESGSYGHNIVEVASGMFQTTWFVAANGSRQVRVVDRASAISFADRWGIDFDFGEPNE